MREIVKRETMRYGVQSQLRVGACSLAESAQWHGCLSRKVACTAILFIVTAGAAMAGTVSCSRRMADIGAQWVDSMLTAVLVAAEARTCADAGEMALTDPS